ncbi:Formin_Homology_2_Domain (plasmid) [Leishmania braziliensis MHOM/BR/75/M2904]|nr:Formin_Homology_2_Domain [Leishmania braziliensis MHOM/BR/75/M2904]
MMRMILAFGNYLNRGTPHADAEGFRLESLNQLNFVKSSDGKTTVLMAFVVSLMDGERSKRERRGSTTSTPSDDDNDVDDARSVLRFVEDVSCIRTVASSPLQDMGQQVSQLNFTLQRMRRVVEEAKDTKVWYDKRLPCVKAEEMPDALPGLLTAAVDRYLARVGQIALRYQELRDDVSAMMATYGEDPNADETVIWGYVLQFSKDVQRCVDTVTATHLTKRRLMRTPEETEQTQSGAKADVAAPPPPSSSGQSSGPRDEVKRTRLPKLVDEDDSGD